MAQSNEIYDQIQGLLGQINPQLDALPTADQYYKDKTNEAYNYNLGPLQNAGQLESQMYSMPGNLMNQYNTEFGGKTGVSSNQRINSILSQLGGQSALTNTARGLADQSGARIDDLAKTLSGQYKTGIEANQMKLSPLMSIWDRMFSEEQANSRANRGSGSGSGYANEEIIIVDRDGDGVPDAPVPGKEGSTTTEGSKPSFFNKVGQTLGLTNEMLSKLSPQYAKLSQGVGTAAKRVSTPITASLNRISGLKNSVSGLLGKYSNVWK